MKTTGPYTRSAMSNGSRAHKAVPWPCLPIDFRAGQSPAKTMNGWGLRVCYGRSFAIHMRSRCGLVRGWPVLSSHFSPGAAPQVGHRTASIWLGLSSFVTQPPRPKGSSIRPVPEAHLDGLRPPDNGHRPILQKGTDKCAIYLQAAVVVDEAFLLERIHKFTYPCACSTNHLR
jgi:hypothetical protein